MRLTSNNAYQIIYHLDNSFSFLNTVGFECQLLDIFIVIIYIPVNVSFFMLLVEQNH